MNTEIFENDLLERTEINFSYKHQGKSTPSRKELLDLIISSQNVKNSELVVIKNCNTRFGQALTTGIAYIYNSKEAMKVEPEYIHKKHESLRDSVPEAEPETEGVSTEEGGDE